MMKRAQLFAVLLVVWCCTAKSDGSCGKRIDFDKRCKKPCSSSADCNKKTVCLCDGVCGMSCIRRGGKCREDYYKKLNDGQIIIKGKNHGDKIFYKCDAGFTLIGPSFQTCSGIRKWKPWDQGTPKCARTCPTVGHPKDGRRVGESFEVGQRVRFRCNPGYDIKGVSTIVCRSSLMWNRKPPVCQPRECGDPVLPQHAEIYRGRSASYLHGDQVSLKCISGFARNGKHTLVCGLDEWKNPPVRCLPKSCGDPGRLTNGRRTGTLFTYRSVVRFLCNQGYRLVGFPTRRCLENQKWSGRVPKCEVKDCGAAPNLVNGRYTGFSTTYGSVQTAQCDIDYKLKGSKTAKCEDSGWSYDGEKPTCQAIPKNCFIRGTITNGYIINQYVDHGNEVRYACNRGYHLNSNVRQTCDDAKVTGSKPFCIKDPPKDCSRPGNIRNGYPTQFNVKHSEEVIYYCNRGYKLRTRKNPYKCDDGQFKGMRPSCVKLKDCNIPRISNGWSRKSRVKHSKKVHYNCYDGYSLKTFTNDYICDDGKLKGDQPRCERDAPMDCEIPEHLRDNIENGKMSSKKVKHGENVKYICDSGHYLVVGRRSQYRCDNGYLRGTNPTCKRRPGYVGCFTSVSGANGNYADGFDECKKQCSRKNYFGFKNGQKTCYCFHSMSEEVNRRSCNKVCPFDKTMICGGDYKYTVYSTGSSCEEIIAPINGRLSTSAVAVGTTVAVSCSDGYQIKGQATLECEDDGQWSHVVPECVLKKSECPELRAPTNLRISTRRRSAGTKVQITCKDGFDREGVASLTCRDSGKWSSRLPKCVAKRKTVYTTGGNANGAPCHFPFSYRGRIHNQCTKTLIGTLWCSTTYDYAKDKTWGKCILTGNDEFSDRYLGCYIDKESRDLSLKDFDFYDHSYKLAPGKSFTEKCITTCGKVSGFRYAGLQWERHCFCGNDYNSYGKGEERSCNMKCEDGKGICGGAWRNSVYKTGCPKPSDPENGKSEDKWYFTNENADYECSDGFQLKGTRQLCDGLNWLHPVPKCVPEIQKAPQCPLTFDDTNLDIIADSRDEGASGIFRCAFNYVLDGESESKCENAAWSGSRKCLAPCKRDRGQGFDYSSANRIHGSSAVQNCTDDRKITYQCQDGRWTETKNVVCRSDCKAPKIRNGNVTVIGKEATFTCKNRYRLSGKQQLRCVDGKWDGKVPRCVFSTSTCINDVIYPLRAIKPSVLNLRPQTFACVGNNELKGSAVSLCQKGHLRQSVPTCQTTTCTSCNSSPEAFDEMCGKHDIVFIGKVSVVNKKAKSVKIKTKYVLKRPKSQRDEVAKKLKKDSFWNLEIDVSGDCVCPRLQKKKNYVVYLKQNHWPDDKKLYFAIPIVIDKTRRAQLAHFCRKA